MLGGRTAKELYEKGKGRSMRGFGSDLGISTTIRKYVRSREMLQRKARPKRGSKLEAIRST